MQDWMVRPYSVELNEVLGQKPHLNFVRRLLGRPIRERQARLRTLTFQMEKMGEGRSIERFEKYTVLAAGAADEMRRMGLSSEQVGGIIFQIEASLRRIDPYSPKGEWRRELVSELERLRDNVLMDELWAQHPNASSIEVGSFGIQIN